MLVMRRSGLPQNTNGERDAATHKVRKWILIYHNTCDKEWRKTW